MSKTADVYTIREHENSVLTQTIPEQTRLSLFYSAQCTLVLYFGADDWNKIASEP